MILRGRSEEFESYLLTLLHALFGGPWEAIPVQSRHVPCWSFAIDTGGHMAQRKDAKKIKKAAADSSSGLQSVIDSAEELLESVKDQQGAVAAQLREKLSDTISKTRDRLEEFDAQEATSDAIDTTVRFIRSDPWRSVAIGAFAFLAVTLLLRRSSAD